MSDEQKTTPPESSQDQAPEASEGQPQAPPEAEPEAKPEAAPTEAKAEPAAPAPPQPKLEPETEAEEERPAPIPLEAMDAKRLLQLEACTRCGECLNWCPVYDQDQRQDILPRAKAA